VYRTSYKLLAGPALASNEDCRVCRCNPGNLTESLHKGLRRANNLLKHGDFFDFFAKCDVFMEKPVFSLLVIFEVRSCAVPTCYVSPFIFGWIQAEQKPAKLPVVPPQPSFELMSLPFEKSPLSFTQKVFMIIWMSELNSRLGSPLIDVDTPK
jgi:hypothetical protein